MGKLESLRPDEIREQLTSERIRIFQILHGSLAGGVLMFMLVVLAVAMKGTEVLPGVPPDPGPVPMLSWVNAAMLVSCVGVGSFAFRTLFNRSKCEEGLQGADNVGAHLIGLLQIAWIVRLAMFEGVALVGLFTCFLGVSSGFLAAEPVYWLNLVSPLSFLAFSAANFPTRDRLAAVIGGVVGVPMMGSR